MTLHAHSYEAMGHPANAGGLAAIAVTFADLPAPYDVYNGRSMFVGPPQGVTETSGLIDPNATPNAPTFHAATLQCNPYYTDWTVYGGPGAPFSLGGVHVHHALIVPGGRYEVSMLRGGCSAGNPANYSPPMSITQAHWGNLAGPYDPQRGRWGPPEESGQVDVTIDVVAGLEKFGNRPAAVNKIRADLEPATVDFRINITDVTRALDAFRGLVYPFPPPAEPCP